MFFWQRTTNPYICTCEEEFTFYLCYVYHLTIKIKSFLESHNNAFSFLLYQMTNALPGNTIWICVMTSLTVVKATSSTSSQWRDDDVTWCLVNVWRWHGQSLTVVCHRCVYFVICRCALNSQFCIETNKRCTALFFISRIVMGGY